MTKRVPEESVLLWVGPAGEVSHHFRRVGTAVLVASPGSSVKGVHRAIYTVWSSDSSDQLYASLFKFTKVGLYCFTAKNPSLYN